MISSLLVCIAYSKTRLMLFAGYGHLSWLLPSPAHSVPGTGGVPGFRASEGSGRQGQLPDDKTGVWWCICAFCTTESPHSFTVSPDPLQSAFCVHSLGLEPHQMSLSTSLGSLSLPGQVEIVPPAVNLKFTHTMQQMLVLSW